MTQDMKDLERDIEETRARLDLTIDRLQDRLSMSGIVDDVLGTMRSRGYDSTFDQVLGVLRRNPVPVMLVAAGIGWLLHRVSRDGTPRTAYDPLDLEEPAVPVLNTGQARIYDPDAPTLHPTHETIETRSDLNARA
jgi:Protein of unknown function (DUF3618)